MGNLGEEPGPWNEKWMKLGDGKVRRGWTKDDDGNWRTFADIARDEAAKAGKTAEVEAYNWPDAVIGITAAGDDIYDFNLL
jgi:hypothetical protein